MLCDGLVVGEGLGGAGSSSRLVGGSWGLGVSVARGCFPAPLQLRVSLLILVDLRGGWGKKKEKKARKRKILAAEVIQTECGRAESLA